MKVLIADDDRGYRDFLRQLLEQEQDVQVTGIAMDSEVTPRNAVARELRRILDGCPICDGGFRHHAYALLGMVVTDEKQGDQKRLEQFFRLLWEHRWEEVLRFREWSATKDTVVAFAFSCNKARLGILTILSPAEAVSPDNPLHFFILSAEEGRKLQAAVAPEKWIPLRSTLSDHQYQ